MASALPAAAAAILAAAPCVGFSGSRAPALASLVAVTQVAAAVPVGVPVIVGDARGIDACARRLADAPQVFFAAAYGSGRGAVAARSIACVR